jgi:hypothetical protein
MPTLGVSSLDLGRSSLRTAFFRVCILRGFFRFRPPRCSAPCPTHVCSHAVSVYVAWRWTQRFRIPSHAVAERLLCKNCIWSFCTAPAIFALRHRRACSSSRPSLGVSSLDLGRSVSDGPFSLLSSTFSTWPGVLRRLRLWHAFWHAMTGAGCFWRAAAKKPTGWPCNLSRCNIDCARGSLVDPAPYSPPWAFPP